MLCKMDIRSLNSIRDGAIHRLVLELLFRVFFRYSLAILMPPFRVFVKVLEDCD